MMFDSEPLDNPLTMEERDKLADDQHDRQQEKNFFEIRKNSLILIKSLLKAVNFRIKKIHTETPLDKNEITDIKKELDFLMQKIKEAI